MQSGIRLTHAYKRVIQFELNEISKPIIDRLISQNKLPYFNTLNQTWSYYQTTSEDRYEHYEPWIQWTTAHTGKTFAEHKIFRLSDAGNLKYPQIWEILSAYGIESCILGSMNTIRGTATDGFFFPDPWTKEGIAYPTEFQPLWNLISQKVNSHATHKMKMKEILKSAKLFLRFNLPLSLYVQIAFQLMQQKIDPLTKWKLVGTFDLLLSNMFKYLTKQKQYRYYTLFLNAAAHYQHHHWRNFDRELFNPSISSPDCRGSHDPVTHGYQDYDKIVKFALDLAKDKENLVIIGSGLSQVPFTQHEDRGGMNYYRLYNHQDFIKKIGLLKHKAISLMSRAWQVEANSQEELTKAKYILESLNVAGEPLFEVEQNTHNSLYMETAITRQVGSDEQIQINGNKVGLFHSFFHNIAIKSGCHTGVGSLWLSIPKQSQTCTDPIPLTDIFHLTLDALGIRSTVSNNKVEVLTT